MLSFVTQRSEWWERVKEGQRESNSRRGKSGWHKFIDSFEILVRDAPHFGLYGTAFNALIRARKDGELGVERIRRKVLAPLEADSGGALWTTTTKVEVKAMKASEVSALKTTDCMKRGENERLHGLRCERDYNWLGEIDYVLNSSPSPARWSHRIVG